VRKLVDNARILVVEDEEIVANYLRECLRVKGYTVSDVVSTGEEAVDKAVSTNPDLVLMDIKLKGKMDGVETAQQIHTTLDTPVVYLTAYADDDLLQRALEAQPYGYIIKPFQEKELFSVIKMALDKHRKEKELRELEQSLRREIEEKFHQLYATMKEGVCLHEILFDKSGNPIDYIILDVNPAYEEITGIDKEKAIGSKASKLYGVEEPPFLDYYAQVAETGESISFETYFQPIDKHFYISVFSPGERLFATIFADITERTKAEKKITELYAWQSAIRKVNEGLLRATDEVDLFQRVCDALQEVDNIEAVWVGICQTDTCEVKPVARTGFTEEYFASMKITYDDTEHGQGPAGTSIKRGQIVTVNDIENDDKFKMWRERALGRGHKAGICVPLMYENEAIGVLALYSRKKDLFQSDEVAFLVETASDIAVGIRSLRLEGELKESLEEMRLMLNETIESMASLGEVRDPYTAGHERRVALLASAIAREIGLPEHQVEGIHIIGFIHDIGKIGIPADILNKPTTLNQYEFGIIKTHPEIAYNVLKKFKFPWPVAQAILQHHERLNGSGYPEGISGDEILIEAKIIGVADVVEAMSSHRPYRPALGIDKALEEISQNKGVLYDTEIVDTCLKLFNEKGFTFE
jgi:PAS domain S-box-containing protein